jgi:drug/metabolite transporter (DMT)-like permease
VNTPGAAAATIRARAWGAWLAVCVIWGTTYLCIKVALETIPPFLMGGLRYVIAGFLLAAALRARGHRLPGRSTWGALAVVSFFMLGLGNGGVVWAEQSVPSGLTAVLIGTSPFWMVGVDALLRQRQRTHARQWLGLAIGFVGIVMLVWPEITAGGEPGRNFGWGVFAVQLACAGWAVGSAYTKRRVLPGDILGSAALQMIFGGIIMLIAGTALGEWPHLSFHRENDRRIRLPHAGRLTRRVRVLLVCPQTPRRRGRVPLHLRESRDRLSRSARCCSAKPFNTRMLVAAGGDCGGDGDGREVRRVTPGNER